MSDGWIRTEERLPTVAEPVLVARVVEIGRPMIVEQGILLPGGIWKTFGHKIKKIRFRNISPNINSNFNEIPHYILF